MPKSVLILGASGNFGAAAAKAFTKAGWQVSRYQRGTDMAAAARGKDLIVNGLNPPMYHDWATLVPRITAEVIGAAKASGARVLVAGNVYVFGTEPGPWGANTPHRPVATKGRIRAAMEASYRAAAAEGVRTIVLRGGDFMQEDNPATIFSMVVLKQVAKGRIASLGLPDVARAYAYLPDIARAAVALAECDDLPDYADIGFPGHSFSITELATLVAATLNRPMKLTGFPWWLMRLASPVWELGRELTEMRYLYNHPHRIDGSDFARLIPDFQSTPLAEVVARHLKELTRQPAARAGRLQSDSD